MQLMKFVVLFLILTSSITSSGYESPELALGIDCEKTLSLNYDRVESLHFNGHQQTESPSDKDSHHDDHCIQHCLHHMFGLLSFCPQVINIKISNLNFFELQRIQSSDFLNSLFRPPIS